MKYEEYQNKIKKVAEVKKIVFRFRILICSILAAIAAICITLFNTKGIITSQTKLAQSQYEYGQTIEYGASGFLVGDKDIHYEFQTVGSEEWNSTLPRHPGNYMIRPFSYNNYGNKVYGDAQNFQIVPKSSTLHILSDEIEYGSKPEISADLIKGDVISSYEVQYDDFSKESPVCSVDFSSVIVKDKNGEDVSDCYSFSGEEKQIKISKKKITIKMHDYKKIYDGNAFPFTEEKNAEITGLFTGDKIVSYPSVSDAAVFTDSGEYHYTGSGLKIVNSDGIDVTSHYDFDLKKEETKGTVTIEKRKLLLQSDSINKEYDGKKIDCGNLQVSLDTPLADTDELIYESNKENLNLFEVCTDVVNEFPIYRIVNKETKEDVTSNYDISVKFGKINITKKKIKVNSKWIGSAEKLYFSDLKSITDLNSVIGFESGELGEGDSLNPTPTLVEDKKTASCHYEYEFKILHENKEDVTSNYDINFTDEIPEIKKKKVTINFSPIKKEYDGKGITEENLNYSSFAIENKTNADKDVIPSYQVSIPSSVTDGVQKKQIDVSLKNKDGKDVTYQYDLEPTVLEYEIKKKPLSVVLDFVSKDFDGDLMSGTYETSGLNPGHKIEIHDGTQKNDVSKGSGKITLSMNHAGSYEYGLEQTDAQREFHELTYSIFDENGNVVNENYDVVFNDSKFDIRKKNLDISISDLVHWYDGASFNPDEINEYLTFDGKSEFDSRFRFKFSLDQTFDGNEYFTSMSTSDVVSYDLSSHLSFRIFDKLNGDVDVTNDFNVRFNSGNAINLYIKRVRISVEFNNSNSKTIPYGMSDSLKVSNNNTDNMYLKVVENDDIQNITSYGYTLSNDQVFEMKLEGKDQGLNGYYTLSIDKLSLTPSPVLQEDYGYKEIKKDKIHLVLSGIEDVIHVSMRKLNFSMRDVKYFYNNKDDYDFGRMTTFTSSFDEENPYAVVQISNTEKDEGLADGDKFVFEKKEGAALKRDGTKNSFSDIVNWKIVNSSGNDVTSCYTPDGTTPYSSDYLLNGSLSIRVPTISLKKNDIQTKPYDGEKRSELKKVYVIDETDSSTKDLYPTDENGNAPELNSVILDTSQNGYASGRAGTYTMKLEQISFLWNGIEFKYDFTKKDEKQGMNIINIDDKDLYEINLLISKAKLSISMSENVDNWNTSELGTALAAKAYYHLYDGKSITLNGNPEEGEISILNELNIEGLATGDEVKFYTKGHGLPLEAKEDDAPYDLNEYFSFKVFKKGTQEEVTDCYDVTDVDLGELYIRKIKADITLKLKQTLYYVGDSLGGISKDDYEVEMKNAFCPNDFKYNVEFEFSPSSISFSSEGEGQISVLKATYNNLVWTPSNNSYMNLSFDTTGMNYQVTTRKVVIEESSFEASYKKNKESYQFKVSNAAGLRSNESVSITYNGKLNLGSNSIKASELKAEVINEDGNIVSNVNVTFKYSDLELIAKAMTLKLYISSGKTVYGNKISFQYDKNRTKLIDFDGRQVKIKDLRLEYENSSNSKMKVGEYSIPEIKGLTLTTEDQTYYYEDLNVELLNTNTKFSVSKRSLNISPKYLLIEKNKIPNPTVTSVKSYLTSLITEKNFKNYCSVNGLANGDEISSFDIEVIYNPSRNMYQYRFVNLKIKDSYTGEDVTNCYDVTSKVVFITVNYVSPDYDDDDFE